MSTHNTNMDENLRDLRKELEVSCVERAKVKAKLELTKKERAEYPQYRDAIDKIAFKLAKELIMLNNHVKLIQKSIEDYEWGIETRDAIKSRVVGQMPTRGKRVIAWKPNITIKALNPDESKVRQLIAKNKRRFELMKKMGRIHRMGN